jgi:hypothetical protein
MRADTLLGSAASDLQIDGSRLAATQLSKLSCNRCHFSLNFCADFAPILALCADFAPIFHSKSRAETKNLEVHSHK